MSLWIILENCKNFSIATIEICKIFYTFSGQQLLYLSLYHQPAGGTFLRGGATGSTICRLIENVAESRETTHSAEQLHQLLLGHITQETVQIGVG